MIEHRELRLLLIDDDADDRALTRLVFARELPAAKCREIADAGAFATAIAGGRFDVAVTDVDLRWAEGAEILDAIREVGGGIPVIAFTTNQDAQLAVDGMKSGFSDWIFKNSKGYVDLPQAVERVWGEAKNRVLAARSEPWLGTLMDKANLAAYRTSVDGQLIESTPALLRLLGVTTVEEALDVNLPEPHFHSDDGEVPLPEPGGERVLQSRQVVVQRADGRDLYLNLTEIMLLDVDGELVIDVLAQDISHLKASELELRSRIEDLERSNADLSQFASIASHELQEPLRMVEKFGAILAEDYSTELGAEGEGLLQSMVDGADRMQVLIDDLLTLSRIDTEGDPFEEVDSNEVVESALLLLEGVVEYNAATIEKDPLPLVYGDESQLIQLWQNLLSNALKFRDEEAPILRISVDESDLEWTFSLEDNGIGIDDNRLRTIFEIFRRLHPELPGTGIGLTICKRIVERHGGRLWAEPVAGPGARFCFTLPRPLESEPNDEDTDGSDSDHSGTGS